MNVEHFETKNCSIFTPILVGISRRRRQGGEPDRDGTALKHR